MQAVLPHSVPLRDTVPSDDTPYATPKAHDATSCHSVPPMRHLHHTYSRMTHGIGHVVSENERVNPWLWLTDAPPGVLQVKEMDQLVDITKDLFAIDRDEMLFQQIRLCGRCRQSRFVKLFILINRSYNIIIMFIY